MYRIGLSSSSVSSSSHSCTVVCSESGRLDALICWFELFLLDPQVIDKRQALEWNTLSTCPHRELNGWDQAVYFSSKFSNLSEINDGSSGSRDMILNRGEKFDIRTEVKKDMTTFSCNVRRKSDTVGDTDMLGVGVDLTGRNKVKATINEMDFALLNDRHRMNCIICGILSVLSFQKMQMRHKKDGLRVLELASSHFSPLLFFHTLFYTNLATPCRECDSKYTEEIRAKILEIGSYTIFASKEIAHFLNEFKDYVAAAGLEVQVTAENDDGATRMNVDIKDSRCEVRFVELLWSA